jgi:hypothetical protein
VVRCCRDQSELVKAPLDHFVPWQSNANVRLEAVPAAGDGQQGRVAAWNEYRVTTAQDRTLDRVEKARLVLERMRHQQPLVDRPRPVARHWPCARRRGRGHLEARLVQAARHRNNRSLLGVGDQYPINSDRQTLCATRRSARAGPVGGRSIMMRGEQPAARALAVLCMKAPVTWPGDPQAAPRNNPLSAAAGARTQDRPTKRERITGPGYSRTEIPLEAYSRGQPNPAVNH